MRTKLKFIIPIIALLLVLVAAIIVFRDQLFKKPEETSSAGVSADLDPNATDYASIPEKANPNATGIQIPGQKDIKVDAKTMKLKSALYNPEGNPCYFVISILLDGKELYKSQMIAPGKMLPNIALNSTLSKGTYNAMIKYESYHVGTMKQQNGADVKVELVVE